MKTLKNHLSSVFLSASLLLCLFLPMTVRAAGSPYILDHAGLFSEQEQEAISEKIQDLQAETGMDYCVATTEDARGYSSQEYADQIYEASGFGTGDNHSGMLYLIDMDNREIYISTEGDMLRYLTDERIDAILDNAYEDAADGDYAASALTVLDDTGSYIEAGIDVNQYNYSSETREVDPYFQKKGFPVLALFFGMIAGLAAALGTFFSVKGKCQLTRDTYHYPLADKSELKLTVSEDRLINQFVTHRRIPKNPPPSSSGRSSSGRTTTHVSRSGRTHGGGGRKF